MTELLITIADISELVPVIAQTELGPGIGKILSLLRMIAFLLAVAALIIAGIMFGQDVFKGALPAGTIHSRLLPGR